MGKSARSVTEKWSRNLGSAGPSMEEGIKAVTESPGVLAAAAMPAYEAGVLEAIRSGKTQRNMASVSLEGWREAALRKGVSRATASARDPQAIAHMESFMTAFLPYAEQVSEEIKRMPKGTLADSIARSTAAIEKMAAFTFDRRR